MDCVWASRHGLFDSVWAKPTLYVDFLASLGSSAQTSALGISMPAPKAAVTVLRFMALSPGLPRSSAPVIYRFVRYKRKMLCLMVFTRLRQPLWYSQNRPG